MLKMMCVNCGNYLVDGERHTSNTRCTAPLSCAKASEEIQRLKDINQELTALNNNLIKAKGVSFDTNTK